MHKDFFTFSFCSLGVGENILSFNTNVSLLCLALEHTIWPLGNLHSLRSQRQDNRRIILIFGVLHHDTCSFKLKHSAQLCCNQGSCNIKMSVFHFLLRQLSSVPPPCPRPNARVKKVSCTWKEHLVGTIALFLNHPLLWCSASIRSSCPEGTWLNRTGVVG